MRKYLSVFSALAVLLSLTACGAAQYSPSENSGDSSVILENSKTSSEKPTDTDDSDHSSGSHIENSVPKPQKPDGEPTFLTLPDGTPIYTSQITKYQNEARDANNSHEQYPLDTFNLETFTDDFLMPEAVCEGFAYAFFPRFNINVSEAPDKFSEIGGVQMYSGEELPPSSEFFKVNVGDKFGSLTVKAAETIFSYSNARFESEETRALPGAYLYNGTIEYEGEVEMTGCIQVRNTEGYSSSGDLWFSPDGESASGIPVIHYNLTAERGIEHFAFSHSGSYGEISEITLGNMYDYSNIDFDGLEPGDEYVRVKIIIKNPIVTNLSVRGEPAAVEVLR